jgi:uncharacterized protein YegJ (DUF2314 family)
MKQFKFLICIAMPALMGFQEPCNPLAEKDMTNKNTFAAVYTLPYFIRNYLPNENQGEKHIRAIVVKDGIKDLVWIDEVVQHGDSLFAGLVHNHPKCADIEKGHEQEVHYDDIVDWLYDERKEDKSIVKHGSFSDGMWSYGDDVNFQNLCGGAVKMYNMQKRQIRNQEQNQK